ncbi:MAG: TIGR02996 domain-containing protein [Gemmataceae bacterium]
MPLRSELLILLEDCKRQPESDALRFIVADWLEEHGTETDQFRAEWVRCQVNHASLPSDHPDRDEYGRRARWLQQRYHRAWLGPLTTWLVQWAGQRGLLEVTLSREHCLSQTLNGLAREECWTWVEGVHLNEMQEPTIERLAGSQLLHRVTQVRFVGSSLGPSSGLVIGKLPWLTNLVQLDLSQQPITTRGVEALLRVGQLHHLRHLHLPGTNLTTDAGALLAEATCAMQLESLTLWGNALMNQGVGGLTQAGGPSALTRLRRLDLRSNVIGNAGAIALAESPRLSQLQHLNLSDNAIGPEGALALAQSPHLRSLETLVLWGNPVGPTGVAVLHQRFGTRVHVSPMGQP